MADHAIPNSSVLYIRNNHPVRAFTDTWERTPWRILPGAEVVAPYFAVCYWFGDPRARNIGDPDAHQETQYRTNEVRRIGVLYGVYDHPWFTDEPYVAIDATDDRDSTNREYVFREEDGKYWHPNFPDVTLRDQDGTVIKTILHDPLGDSDALDATTLAQASVLESSVAELQRQLAQMQTQLAVQQQTLAANPEFEGEAGAKVDLPATMPEAPASSDGLPATRPPPPATRPTVDRPTRPVRG